MEMNKDNCGKHGKVSNKTLLLPSGVRVDDGPGCHIDATPFTLAV